MATSPRYLIDTYLDFVAAEGVPVVESFGIDLLGVETRPWARPTDSQKHLYEEVVYVLDGRGSTTIEASDGSRHSFEWGPKSLFALPLNARYQHFNTSGQRAARLAGVTNLPMVLNAFHNFDFIFNNPFAFPDRLGEEKHFTGDGTFLPTRPGRHMWETNFVPDLSNFKLMEWQERGAGGSSIMFVLANGTMHAHMSEMPVGTYKKAHRHGPDFHVFAVTGHGFSLLWYEGEQDFVRIDWKHGWVFAPPDQMFHQHFNTAPDPARYLAVAFGSLRYPFTTDKRRLFLGMDVSVKDGGCQIEYEHQDPRIHEIYLAELARHGVPSGMGKFIDERPYAKASA